MMKEVKVMRSKSLVEAPKQGTEGKPVVLIAAGASGGHLFPALAVAEELRGRGYTCVFVLGGGKFGHLVEAAGFKLERLPAAAFADRGPVALAVACVKLLGGLVKALRLVRRYKPIVAFGTGGYATVATLMAAKVWGVPAVIHEQNAILGRANRFLAGCVDKVLLTFEGTPMEPVKASVKVVGTPLRAEILEARRKVRHEDGTFRILVLGGSMGARILSAVVPAMVCALPLRIRAKLVVVQQARSEDVEAVSARYKEAQLAGFEVKTFFDDMPARYVQAHVVIGRSGVGTLLEAATLGRAAIYCPHLLADNHQLRNAEVAVNAGAAVLIEQPQFTPERLGKELLGIMEDKPRLVAMEAAALTLARPTAAVDCAAEVLAVSKGV